MATLPSDEPVRQPDRFGTDRAPDYVREPAAGASPFRSVFRLMSAVRGGSGRQVGQGSR